VEKVNTFDYFEKFQPFRFLDVHLNPRLESLASLLSNKTEKQWLGHLTKKASP
jgi:hypothetical protein